MLRTLLVIAVLVGGVYPMLPPVDMQVPEVNLTEDEPEEEQEIVPFNATEKITVNTSINVFQYSPGDHDATARVVIRSNASEEYEVTATVVPVAENGFVYHDKQMTVSQNVHQHSTETSEVEWNSNSNVEKSFGSVKVVSIEVCTPYLFDFTDCREVSYDG